MLCIILDTHGVIIPRGVVKPRPKPHRRSLLVLRRLEARSYRAGSGMHYTGTPSPPHPVPLPIRWGEGEPFTRLVAVCRILSPILRTGQYGQFPDTKQWFAREFTRDKLNRALPQRSRNLQRIAGGRPVALRQFQRLLAQGLAERLFRQPPMEVSARARINRPPRPPVDARIRCRIDSNGRLTGLGELDIF